MDGQQVRLADGIHFSFTGGDVFASRIWPEVVSLGRQQVARSG
jgi:lysophospholipase L1-like esterase